MTEKIELQYATAALAGNVTCVLQRAGHHVAASQEKGIRPLVLWLEQDQAFLQGAVIADRIIGRAAAMLAIYGGAIAVYGQIMSEGAAALLRNAGIPAEWGTLTEQIINRRGDGPCPMEQAVADISDPVCAYTILKSKVFGR